MATVLSKGSLFPSELVNGMINQVKGASVLAQLTGATPIPFNGQTEFIFNMDNEIGIVAENAAKPAQSASITTRTITPLKVVYTMRTSSEFMIENDEYQLGVLQAFGEGWARKLAKGLDLMAIHGMINGMPVQVSTNVSHKATDATATDQFLLGDFTNSFRWGYARQMPIEVIEYGDPDNTGNDLKAYNQVAIRGEAYLGWAIFNKDAFALYSVAGA